MKLTILSTLFVLALSTQAMAVAPAKVCFGSKNNDDTKGVILEVHANIDSIKIKTTKSGHSAFGEGYYEDGNYPSLGTKKTARSGIVYLEYKGENTDYQDIIMLDEALLNAGTTGLLQIRARGEGFFNSVFVCKDKQN